MHHLTVKNFAEWRNSARYLINKRVPPQHVRWTSATASQGDLFDALTIPISDKQNQKKFTVSKAFVSLANGLSHHRDIRKWGLMYQLLWRICNKEPQLLKIASDPLVHESMQMLKSVKRDMHKMKAFVRFCKYDEDGEHYLAWYKPDHLIVKAVAPFFQRRFAVMRWSIITPDESVSWNGNALVFGEGKILDTNPQDGLEHLWRTYYRAIFNPARVKVAAMKREMPARFWHNLPETSLIPELLAEASSRAHAMIATREGFESSALEYVPQENKSLQNLQSAAIGCKGCPLYKPATQTVFGTGNPKAKIMVIGEQPGDLEDLHGLPFVGPAGALLHQSLINVGADAADFYFTNAVKHFKYSVTNSHRMHRSPSIREVHACKPWLLAEIEAIKPKVILCLGLTAAKALISPGFVIKEARGVFEKKEDYIIGATYHPAALLRTINALKKQEMLRTFEQDIQTAHRYSF